MAKKNSAAAAVPEPEQLAIDIPEATRKPRVSVVPRAIIHPDPHQPRVDADADLRASIARNGIIQPLTVRPHPERSGEYMLVDGERRWRGSAEILDELPVIIRRDQEDGARRLVTQVVANSGKPLAPIEEAKAYRQIVEDTGLSIADAADLVGVPRSTFAERLRLLDLGPWLELLQLGEITVSQAVRALVPLAGIPAKYHEQMIAKVRKDYRWGKRGGPGMSLSDFENLIRICYTPLMYPLKKSSSSWLKQPEFPTSKHDDECTCGAPKFELSGSGARVCCGNPDWWRPKHRKAMAAKKAAAPKDKAPAKKALTLPEGHTTARVSWEGDAPKGVTLLSTRAGTWRTSSGYHGTEPRFDPADLGELDPAKLVLVDWPNRRPGEYPVVGTRQTSAVKRATEAWQARFAQRREAIAQELREQAEPHKGAFRVEGPGARKLLEPIARHQANDGLLDILDLLGIEHGLHGVPSYNLGGKLAAFLGKLDEPTAAQVATLYATIAGRSLKPTTARLEEEQAAALVAIAKRKVPWLGAAKAKKSTTPKKAAAPATPVDTSTLACTGCGCTEDEACDGGCHWVTTSPAVCSQCAENDAAVDADLEALGEGDEALWDASEDEELEELES